MPPRRLLIVLLAAGLLIALSLPASVGAARPLPNSMAAAGDSITRAFNTCRFPFTDCPANSWSTGTSTTVQSHYLRIHAENRKIRGKNYNDARSGADMGDLPGQMATIAGRNVDYVTVQMGGNDLCTSSVETMTSVESFSASFTAAMDTITASPTVSTVYVTSIPDVYHLWELFHGNSTARATWDRWDICQSLLANPSSTDPADVERRAEVRQRNVELNQALEAICAQYAPECVWDGWTVFCTPFAAADVTTRDYFHPSVTGQKNLAAASWGAGPFVVDPTAHPGADCVP